MRLVIVIVLIAGLGGCVFPGGWAGAVLGGAIGAALQPVVTPQVDRGLHAIGADAVDPAGTEPFKSDPKK